MTDTTTPVLSTSSDTLTLNAYLESISKQTKRCVILNGNAYIHEINISGLNIGNMSSGNIEHILSKFDIGVHVPREKIKYKDYLLLYKLYSDLKDLPAISCEEIKLCVKKIDQAAHELLSGGIQASLNKAESLSWSSYNLDQELPVVELNPVLRARLFTVLVARFCGPINELKGISRHFNVAVEEPARSEEGEDNPVSARRLPLPNTFERLWPKLFRGSFFQFSPYLGRRALTVIGTPQSSESLFRAIAEIQDLMISSLDGSRMTLVVRVPKGALELSQIKTQLLEFIPGPCRDAIHFTPDNSLQCRDSAYSEEALPDALRQAAEYAREDAWERDRAAYYLFITQVLQRIQKIQVPTEALLFRFDEALISGERDSTGETSVLRLRVRLPGEAACTRLTVSEKGLQTKAIPAVA